MELDLIIKSNSNYKPGDKSEIESTFSIPPEEKASQQEDKDLTSDIKKDFTGFLSRLAASIPGNITIQITINGNQK